MYIYFIDLGNFKGYIGKTGNPVLRERDHKNLFKIKEFIILDEVPEDEWKFWEKWYIQLFKSWGFILENKNNGGGGCNAHKDSSKTLISKKLQNRNITWNVGRPIGSSDIIKTLNREKSHIGRDYSYLKNKAGSKKGVKKSKIHAERIKMSARNKFVRIYCPELDKIFESVTEASKFLNKRTGNISNILKSKTNKTREGLTLIRYE